MRKIITTITLLLCMGIFAGCETEVAEFDSVKDAIETAKDEAAEAVEEAKEDIDKEVLKKDRTAAERMKDPETLTVETNDELARLLTSALDDSEYTKFFEDNKYNIIEFNGALDLVELIPGKKTRYSMILRAGDYDANSMTGPLFFVKDVGASDSSVKDVFLTGNAEMGKHVKIIAQIYGFDEARGAVELQIKSMSIR